MDSIPTTICWICGNVADSSEHRIKKSDLKLYFGDTNEKNYLLSSSNDEEFRRVKSLDSSNLKYKKSICKACNNSTTQKHDLAWQAVSEHFYQQYAELKKVKRWAPKVIFRSFIKESCIHMHLYFVKMFGCMANDAQLDIFNPNLSNVIMNNQSLDGFYLQFGWIEGLTNGNRFIQTDIKEANNIYIFNYLVGRILVRAIYAPLLDKKVCNRWYWHPSSKRMHIKFHAFKPIND